MSVLFFSPFFRFIGDEPRVSSANPSRTRIGFDSDLLNDSGIRVISDHAESDTTRPSRIRLGRDCEHWPLVV